jgi:hypothetical protein
VVNVFHYTCGILYRPTGPDLALFLAGLNANIATFWGACFPPAYVPSSVTARWMEDGSTPAVTDPLVANYTGTYAAGDYQPTDSAWSIEKVTPFRNRSGRGMFHLSPVPEAATLDFRLTGAFLAGPAAGLVNNLIATFITDVPPFNTTWQPFLFSRKASTIVIGGACQIYGTPITTMRVRKTLGSMDRRKIKGVY